MNKHTGLYLLPSPIADEGFSFLGMPESERVQSISFWIVENIREARRNLRKMGFTRAFDEMTIVEWNENTSDQEKQQILAQLSTEPLAVLMSDAGLPCIADPGGQVVAYAQQKRIPVYPIVGPSSIMLTLMASGMNGQRFRFHGYLPREKNERIKMLKQLESSINSGESQIFMDTPYRNNAVLEDCIQHLSKATYLCIGVGIHGPHQRILTQSLEQWKKSTLDLHKTPAMFILGKPLMT
jgi:16S rRNA (cytidine1402-2'-O)-methyltransferase